MNRIKYILIAAAILIMAGGSQASAADRSKEFDSIGSYLESALKNANIPGASIEIVDKDNILYQKTYGNCKSIDTPFIIGSLSKSFTAMAIMKLADEDKIELDSPISEYLPEAPDSKAVTVRQLLNQTSGIDTYAGQEHYEITASQGTHVYANANYGLLGRIIERVTGCSYEDYVKNNIFTSIGMKHSYTSLKEAKGKGLINGYRNYFGLTIKDRVSYPEPDSTGWLSVPAGYLISSASDMGRYLQVYLSGGKGIVSSESIHSMFYDNVEIMPEVYYGMGWELLNNKSEPVLEHTGLTENYFTDMFLLPESGLGVILLTNTNDYLVANYLMYAVYESVKRILLGEEPVRIEASAYWGRHIFLDAVYLIFAVLCLLPLLRIRKWIKRREKSKSLKWLISFIGIHLVLPSVILLIPFFMGVPVKVMKGFAPDLFLIYVFGITILYGTGILKLILKLNAARC